MSPEIRRSRRGRWWRRLRRAARQHPRRAVALGGFGVVVIALLWCGWRAWSVADDLGAASRDAEVLRAALARGDVESAADALDRFAASSQSAADGSDGPTWWLFEHAPVLGDDARGVATVAAVLADLARDGLPPVVDAATAVTADAFAPSEHRFPLARIEAMSEPARASEQAFATAVTELEALDGDGWFGPLRTRLDTLRDQVAIARTALDSAYRATRLMPRMLGAAQPRHYLLVLENNAELRSTGGLPGSLTLVRASRGEVEIVEQADMTELGFANVDELLPGEAELFGPALVRFGVDANLTPDVPRAADLIRARWEQVARTGAAPGIGPVDLGPEAAAELDGVVFVDPVAISALMAGMGTLPVPGYEPISSATVVAAVENEIYLASLDPAVHSDYQNGVAEAVFDAFADSIGDPITTLRGLATGVGEGRIRMHLSDPEAQRIIAGTAIAGEFDQVASEAPEVGVYLNDSTESKMSYYLHVQADAAVQGCVDGYQDVVVTVSLTNSATDVDELPVSVTGTGNPRRDIAPGEQLVVVYLTSPVQGSLRELEINGVGDRPAITTYRGREVATAALRLTPGETQTLRLVARSGIRQRGDIRFTVTPTSTPGTHSATLPSAC